MQISRSHIAFKVLAKNSHRYDEKIIIHNERFKCKQPYVTGYR